MVVCIYLLLNYKSLNGYSKGARLRNNPTQPAERRWNKNDEALSEQLTSFLRALELST